MFHIGLSKKKKIPLEKKKMRIDHSSTFSLPLGKTIRFNVRIPQETNNVKIIKDVLLRGNIVPANLGSLGYIKLHTFWQLAKNVLFKINGKTLLPELDNDVRIGQTRVQRIYEKSPTWNDVFKHFHQDNWAYSYTTNEITAVPYDDTTSQYTTTHAFCESILDLFPELKNLDVRHLEPNRDDQIYLEFELIKETTAANYTNYLQYRITDGGGVDTGGNLSDHLTVEDLYIEIHYEEHLHFFHSLPKTLGTLKHLRKEYVAWEYGQFGDDVSRLTAKINLRNVFPSLNNVSKIYLDYKPKTGDSTLPTTTVNYLSGHPYVNELIENLSKITIKKNGNIFWEYESPREFANHYDISYQANHGHRTLANYDWPIHGVYMPYIDFGLLMSDLWNDSAVKGHGAHLKQLNGVNLNSQTYEVTIELANVVPSAHDGYVLTLISEVDRIVSISGKTIQLTETIA